MENKLPKATHEGLMPINEVKLNCAVLDNGVRILSQSAVYKALDRPVRSKVKVGNRADQMPSFLDANNLQPYVDQELKDMIKEVEYISIDGKVVKGYNARIIPRVANVYLKARRADALTKKQEHVAEACEKLVAALADRGIESLVDIATGFTEFKEKAKENVVLFLEKSLQLEPAKWVKTFPDEFFELIFKMKGWNWTKTSKRPGVVGHYINDLVYSRIAPNFLTELRKLNPSVNGKRKRKHHDYATRDFGHPIIKDHISGLIALGRVANNDWNIYKQMVDKAYPVYGQTIKIDFAIDYDKKLQKELPPQKLSTFNQVLNKALNHNPKKDNPDS